MTENEVELKKLHKEIFEMYHGHTTDVVRMNQLWNRVDVLEQEVALERQRAAWSGPVVPAGSKAFA